MHDLQSHAQDVNRFCPPPLFDHMCRWKHTGSDPLQMAAIYNLEGLFCHAECGSHLG